MKNRLTEKSYSRLIKFAISLVLFALMLTSPEVVAQSQTDQQLGLQFFNDKEYEKAVEIFERLYKDKPDHFSYTYYLQSLLELGKTDDATKLVKQQVKRFPNDLKYQVDQGFIMIRSNQTQKAVKLYDDLVKDLKPEQRQVMELASAFLMRRENDYAIKVYQKGRQLLSPEHTFGFELAQMYEIQGQFDKMVEEYMLLIEQMPGYADQVQNRLQFSLQNDPENLKTEALRRALITHVQKRPDNITLTEMLIWLSLQLRDFESALLQAKALDRRLKENGSRVFALGQLSVTNENYDAAISAFSYVMDNSDDLSLKMIAEVELLRSEYRLNTSSYPVDIDKLRRIADKFNSTISRQGSNPLTYPLIRDLAHIDAFYLNNSEKAITVLQDLIARTGNDRMLQAQSKLELADIYLFSGEPWEATLLYSQVDKTFRNDPIGHEAKFRNAKLSFYIGEFDWARAQLDVLKAATSKLIANDAMQISLMISDNIEYDSSTVALGSYARADLLSFRNMHDKAYLLLDSVIKAFPGHPIIDDALMKQAEIKKLEGDFAAAEKLYLKVIEDHSGEILADDALYELASIYEIQLQNKQKAMDTYQKLMTEYPGSLFVVDARRKFRELRGDFQGEKPVSIQLP